MQIRPTISVFSDNVVLSVPLDTGGSFPLECWDVLTCFHHYIEKIAWSAFEARLLIRGGIAIGPLHHKAGIVMGPALVEAYQIEKTVAVYPRIVLSPALTKLLSPSQRTVVSIVEEQDDGAFAMEYLTYLVVVKGRSKRVRSIVSKEIASLKAANSLAALAKWKWFNGQVEKTIDRWDPANSKRR